VTVETDRHAGGLPGKGWYSRNMAPSSGFVPRRRPQGLVTEHLEGETLLYVEATHRAFCLNLPAARVWEAIDGRRDVGEIAKQASLDAANGSGLSVAVLRALRPGIIRFNSSGSEPR